jgi:hypothetical protein
MNRRVLLTGAGGLIGRAITPLLPVSAPLPPERPQGPDHASWLVDGGGWAES